MDQNHVNDRARDISSLHSRRGLLGLVATVPLVGALLAWLTPNAQVTEAAKHSRKRREEPGKRKRRKGCKPKGKDAVCAGRCGPVANKQTCNKRVDCGPCDSGSDCVASAWSSQTTLGSLGEGAGQFERPYGMALSADALTLWVADTRNSRISVWTRPDTTSADWVNVTSFSDPKKFIHPRSVALSADELTMWVANYIYGRVTIVTRPTTRSAEWSTWTSLDYPGWDPNAYAHSTSVVISGDGLTAWVAESGNDRIAVWGRPDVSSPAWTQQATFGGRGSGPDQVHDPAGLAVSADGLTVWVADYGNDRIAIWTRPEANSTTWTNRSTFGSTGAGRSQFNGPSGVALSPDELTMWVADYANNRVSVWSRPSTSSHEWTNQTTFGRRGDGASQLHGPAGVTVSADGQTLFVADALNDRISVWRLSCLA